VFWCKKC